MDLFDSRSASSMLIARQTDPFDDPDCIYELKMDGFRCLSYMDQNSVDLRNKRNMKMLSKFPELKEIYKNVRNRCILDGEVVVLVNGVPDFYRLQKRTLLTDRFKIELEASRYPASYVAFDCMYEENKEFIWESLLERKACLSRLVTESPRMAVSRYIEQQGVALFAAAEDRKLEGVVAKKKKGIYYMGKRSNEWVKFKRMADEDYVDPFRMIPTGNEDAVWVEPDHVCVVEYMPNTLNSLRQPVFKGFRDDVFPKEVQAES